jgi:hypothetical protein
MICIKKRIFSNKIDVTAKANIQSNNPHSQIGENHESDIPNQEITTNPAEVTNTNKKCQIALICFQTSSDETSLADFIQDQASSVDVQEVIQQFLESPLVSQTIIIIKIKASD